MSDEGTAEHLLAVDDEPMNLTILREFLEDSGYRVSTASDGEEALAALDDRSLAFDAVILDRMMPGMDGIEVLKTMQRHPEHRAIPVILQTALSGKADIAEGLAGGAFYYLTKPFEPEVLRSVVRAALDRRAELDEIREAIRLQHTALRLMAAGRFEFKTIDEARSLASTLAAAFPDPDRVALGLLELLLNAVEHGNLDLSYEDKSRLTSRRAFDDELARRCALPEYAERRVRVTLERGDEVLQVRIRDDGKGFDPTPYVEFDPDRAFDLHGRGILMAKSLSFDNLEYVGKGNEVVVGVRLSPSQSPRS